MYNASEGFILPLFKRVVNALYSEFNSVSQNSNIVLPVAFLINLQALCITLLYKVIT